MRPVALFVICLCCIGIGSGAEPSRPNIVLIMADDLGYETLGCYGGISYKTPNLDRLAASGVRFTHAYSQPLCSPSRVKIMTGRYSHRNYTNWGILPKDDPTFANLLRSAGYATFVAGKWQLWGHDLLWPVDEPCCLGQGQLPEEAGFDDHLCWYIRGKGSRYADPVLWSSAGETEHAGKYGPDLLADFVTESIERQLTQNPAQPFFVYYPMVLTHAPFTPTPGSKDWDTDRQNNDPTNFANMVEYMDKMVGRVIDKIEQLSVRENTLFLFTADNGTPRAIVSKMSDGATIRGGKGRTIDAGVHVPMIASWPETLAGDRVSDALVDLTDFLPTIVDAAGWELPSDREFDGFSLMPHLRADSTHPRGWIFTDYRPRFPGMEEATFAQDRRFKLYSDGRFFDLGADVEEVSALSPTDLSTDALRAKTKLQLALDQTLGRP